MRFRLDRGASIGMPEHGSSPKREADIERWTGAWSYHSEITAILRNAFPELARTMRVVRKSKVDRSKGHPKMGVPFALEKGSKTL